MLLNNVGRFWRSLDTDQAFEVSLQTTFSSLLTFALVFDVRGFPVNIFIYS